MRTKLILASSLAAGALVLAGCSSGTDTTSQSGGSASGSPEAAAQTCSFDTTVGGVTATAADGKAPVLTVAPDAEVPEKLEITDLCEGEGTPATSADTVTVHYVGVGYKSQEEFDSSYGRGEPATFPLSQVIPGWTEGVSGMAPGGARLLRIPPDQAYGANPPAGGAIKKNEALAFIVEMQQINQ